MADGNFNAGSAQLKITPRLAPDFNTKLRGELSRVKVTHKVDVSLGSLTQFRKDLKTALAATTGDVKAGVKLGSLTAFRADLKTQLGKIKATVDVTPKLKGVAAFKTELQSKLASTNVHADVGVKLDFTQANAQLSAWRAAQGAVPLSLNVNLDTGAAMAQLAALRTMLRGIDLGSVGAGALGGGRSGSGRNGGGMIRRIRVQMEVDRASVARAEADLAQATARLDRSRVQQSDAIDRVRLAQTRLTEAQSRYGASSSQVMAATQNLARAQRDLADRSGDVNRHLGSQADAHNRLGRAQQNQNSFTRLAMAGLQGFTQTLAAGATSLIKMINPAGLVTAALMSVAAVNLVPLVATLAQAAGVLALLPAMGAAAASGLAAVVIGGSGIADAFQAAKKMTEAAGKEAEATAKKQADAARAVEDAQRGVEDAARGVEDAQQGVSDAHENAARTAKDGARQIVQAERQVEDAQRRTKQAQEDLTRARKDALEQIEDMNLALKGSAIDEEDALIALERARERLRELGKDGRPVSGLDRREAENNVRSALQRVDEVRERNNDLRQETLAANKAGVEGADQVVAAKEAVADAIQGEKDAQENLGVTQENVARSNAQAQRQIEDALRRVADAQRSQADAARNHAEALARQAEAFENSSTAADEFNDAMAKLSPNAQDFVNKMREMGDAWTSLRTLIQDNLFANLGTSIQQLADNYFPLLKTGLGGIATEINGGILGLIRALNEEGAKSNFAAIFENTRISIKPFMDGLTALAGALGNFAAVGSEFLPGIAQGFSDLMTKFQEWSGSDEGKTWLRDFIQDSIDAFKQVIDFAVALGRVIGTLFSTTEDQGSSMLQSFTENLNKFADWMGTPEGQERVKQFFSDARDMLNGIIGAIQKVLEVSQWLKDRFMEVKGVLEGFRDTVSNVATRVVESITTIRDNISEFRELVFTKIGEIIGFFLDLPVRVGEAVGKIINEHFPGLSGALTTLQTTFQNIVSGIGDIWDGLKQRLAGPINFLIGTVYNDGIAKFWNAVGPKIGLGTLDPLPLINDGAGSGAGFGKAKVPGLAKGGTVDGVMSGYTPGVDDRVIAVGGGEAVMRPEWTRAVGKDFVENANAAARSGGVDGVRKFMGYYADGGVVASMEDVVRKHFPMLLTNNAAFSGLRFTDDGYHSKGMAADFSNGGDAGTPEMKAFAHYIADEYQNRTLELIHSPFDRNINNYQSVGDGYGFYGAGTMDQHRNHVHWAVDGPVGEGGAPDPSLWDKIKSGVGGAVGRVSSFFRNLAADQFEGPLNALGSRIPQFEGVGEFGRIPRALYDTMKDKLIGFVRGAATGKDNASGSGSSGAPLGSFGGNAMDYAREIVGAAKDRGLPSKAAKIGLMTALAESSLRMWANESVPESLNFPHDAVGSDHDSVGLFQQRDNGAWGTVEQRMNPRASAGMFYDALMGVDWNNMSPAAAAQAVQRSAFSDGSNYAVHEGRADELVAQLYDAGGVIEPGKVAVNLSGEPEAVFTHDEWKMLQNFAALVGRPDFIDALQASAYQGPIEPVTKVEGYTTGYGTGAGTVGANGYQQPTGNLASDLASFDRQNGVNGGGGVRGVVSGATSKLNALLPGVKAMLPAEYQQLVPDALPDVSGAIPDGLGAGSGFTDSNPELPWYMSADPAGTLAGRAGNLAQSQLQGWGDYFKNSWPEMLETAVGMAGVGGLNAAAGGMTINGNVGMGPRELQAVQQRHDARVNRASKRSVLGR